MFPYMVPSNLFFPILTVLSPKQKKHGRQARAEVARLEAEMEMLGIFVKQFLWIWMMWMFLQK